MTDVQHRPQDDLQDFEVRVTPEQDRIRVYVTGELDLATAPLLEQPLTNALEAGFDKLVLDLTDLTFIDSSGLRLVIQTHRKAADIDASLTVEGAHGAPLKAFELAGLTSYLELVA